jgi:predicted phage-related endonuclease
MKTIPYRQGSPEWLAERSTPNTYTASEAPAMLGLSKYKTRTELIREKATGITPEVDAFTQVLFDAGHEAEASTRAWAETEVGDDLYPVTGTIEIDGLRLLASFDGLTMDETIAWENKKWNQEFAAQVLAGDVPDTHWPQLEQQILVSGAEKVLFTVSDGGETAIAHLWYTSQPERRSQLIAGWKQFAEDVRNYNPASITVEEAVTGRAPDMLPALHIEVTGMVTASNLAQFKATALTVFRGINTNLQTDQDFADAEKAVKFCKDAEERLDAAKSHALSQTASIDELFRTIDQIKDEAKAVRLKLDKLVKGEKENRKTEIVIQARDAMLAHLHALEYRLGGAWMPRAEAFPPVGDVVKGLKTLDSMRDRLSVWLANSKVQANEVADRIERNHKSVEDWTLVPDFGAICQKAPEDFAALISMRKTQRAEAEAKRLEAERARIRAEEQAKAEREAQAKARAEQAERDAEAARLRLIEEERVAKAQAQAIAEALAADRAKQEADALSHGFGVAPTMGIPVIEQNQHVADDGATMTIGRISAILGFNLTAMFLEQLGFKPVAHDKNAKIYRASDFPRICAALVRHINHVTPEWSRT